MAATALVVSVTNSISFVKELLESAGDAPPYHEILVECEVVLTKCLADPAHISSDGELHDLVNWRKFDRWRRHLNHVVCHSNDELELGANRGEGAFSDTDEGRKEWRQAAEPA